MKIRAVSVAQMGRMIRAIEEAGLPFAGFRAWPDGRIDALVETSGAHADAAKLDGDSGSWAAYDARQG